VFVRDGSVYRALDDRSHGTWELLQQTRFFPAGVAAGRIIDTEPAPEVEPIGGGDWAAVLRHERIPVVSYPYEWTFSMLQDAALLQLDLLDAALDEDVILKDATPFNIQWRGTEPIFIDIGSFEPLREGDVWVGYRQFLGQFLYPLMLTARVGIPFQPWLRGQPDGITAEQIQKVLPARDLLRKSSLMHVVLPARAERHYDGDNRNVRSELKDAGFSKEMIQNNVRGLRRIVADLEWRPGSSEWNRYASGCEHVSHQRDTKALFVAQTVAATRPGTVWDVGANDGHFSRIAAATADYVLALDADTLVLDELYRALRSGGEGNILPLVQDVADPSPGIGWRGRERPPLVDRSSPDLVLCLAVIHHLVVGRNVPLHDVVDWLRDLRSRVVLEFVPPDDPMVQGLTANKRPHEIHGDYHEGALREYLGTRFAIEREEEVPGSGRRLFELRPIG